MFKKTKNSEKISALNGEHYIVDENNNIIQWFYDNGNLKYEKSIKDNKFHNDNGPSFITYYRNGQKKCVEYHRNGDLHNTEGPAVILYDIDGNIIKKIYYLDNDLIVSIPE